jgi:hypothetical protein
MIGLLAVSLQCPAIRKYFVSTAVVTGVPTLCLPRVPKATETHGYCVTTKPARLRRVSGI